MRCSVNTICNNYLKCQVLALTLITYSKCLSLSLSYVHGEGYEWTIDILNTCSFTTFKIQYPAVSRKCYFRCICKHLWYWWKNYLKWWVIQLATHWKVYKLKHLLNSGELRVSSSMYSQDMYNSLNKLHISKCLSLCISGGFS